MLLQKKPFYKIPGDGIPVKFIDILMEKNYISSKKRFSIDGVIFNE